MITTTEIVPAPPGAEFVVVGSQLTNNTASGIDLPCSGPVGVKLIDDHDRQFSEGDEGACLFADNPECNADTNPGFTVPMTWYFAVPVGTPIGGLKFTDDTGYFDTESPSTTIRSRGVTIDIE